MKKILEHLFPNRIIYPKHLDNIPGNNQYMVYILTAGENTILLGHGRKNRAKVILDSESSITKNHIKALFVRFYILFSDLKLTPYIITCTDKKEANKIENQLHKLVGGNNRIIPESIKNKLFKNIPERSRAKLFLEIAISSSFDGLQDIKRWYKDGIIDEDSWIILSEKLKLSNTNF